ncbi:MAG: acyl--CoA ligase [Phycisphaerales bacterium]|nr:acyl--CoA ligase [Phycisphaerales bacterium]
MAAELIRAVICHVQRNPGKVAVRTSDGEEITRGEIFGRAIETARILDDVVSPDATVMLHGPGGANFWSGFLAVLGTGRRLLPVGDEVPDRDRHNLAKAHNVDAILETAMERAPARGHDVRLHTGIAVSESGSDSGLARGARSSILLRSSGTSGSPSVILRPGPTLDAVVGTLIHILDLQEEDHVLAALPMQHSYGLEHALMAPMVAGSSVSWRAGFDLNWGLEELEQRATVFPAVPATLEACVRETPPSHRLRLAYSAGSPLPPSVSEAFTEAWGTPVGNLYGASELGTITWGVGERGRPVFGVSVQVSSDGKTACEHGEGELLVRSEGMFEGYLDQGSAEVEPGDRIDDHLRTGDLGRVHPDGSVEVTGRIKAQFDVGGLKVNPVDVENVLRGQQGVRDIAVVPLVLSDTVTRVRIVVVAADDFDEEALRDGLFRRAAKLLPPHQRPRVIHFQESLPRTPSGKLLRHELLEEHLESHA